MSPRKSPFFELKSGSVDTLLFVVKTTELDAMRAELTRRFEEFGVLGLPLLAAVSNKDFIGESIDAPQGQRLEGSIAAMVVCIMKGARVVRMHDIPQSVAAVRMTEAILGLRPPVRVEHNAQEWNV